MSASSYGENLAELLDKGANLLPVLPEDNIVGRGASYFGDGGMLRLAQSPYLPDAHAGRLCILGAVSGMGSYGDEKSFVFALSNNVSLPDGTFVHLEEPKRPEGAAIATFRLPENAIDVSFEVSDFVRTIAGKLMSADLRFDAAAEGGIKADVSGVFNSDEMRDAYLKTLEKGTIVNEESLPTSAEAVACITHTLLTPLTRQVVIFSMNDHRPGNREEMLRLKGGS